MQKTNYFDIYQILSSIKRTQKGLNGFMQYLSSDIFGAKPGHKKITEAWGKILEHQIPHSEWVKYLRKRGFKSPKSKNYLDMRMSQFKKELENYLVFRQWMRPEINGPMKKWLLLEAYTELELIEATQKVFKSQLNTNKFYSNLKMTFSHLENATFNYFFSKIRVYNDHSVLPQIHKTLNHNFCLEKLKYACASLNESKLFGHRFDLPFLSPVIDFSETSSPPQIITGYLLAYKCLKQLIFPEQNEDHSHFNNLKFFLQKNADLPKEELRDLLTYALNYSTDKERKETDFQKETFELYKWGIEQRVFLGKFIFPKELNNILSVFLRQGADFEFFTTGYHSLKKRIMEKDQGSFLKFFEGRLAFHSRDFAKSRKIFQSIPDRKLDMRFRLQLRSYLAKSHLHLGELDSAQTLLENFAKFLNDQTKRTNYGSISKETKMLYMDFIRYMKKLIQIQSLPLQKDTKLKDLTKSIRKEQGNKIAFRWFFELIESEQK